MLFLQYCLTNHIVIFVAASSEIYIAGGGIVHLNFSFSYINFGVVELWHNDRPVFVRRSGTTENNSRTPSILFDSSGGITTFTITDAVASDNGRYICLLNKVQQDPVYDLTVICK